MIKAEEAIVARDLRKRFPVGMGLRRKQVEALKGVTFTVRRGEIYALLGPNGAGKTTTVRIISTLLLPDSGEARVLGYDVVKDRWEVRKRIGVMLSVERGFYWKLTARENLYYFGRIYGIPKRELLGKIEEVLDLVGLKEIGAEDKPYEEMSLGMKARLGLARVLLKDPEVLILDEPTLGLDPPSARMIRSMLRSLADEGRTVLVTTHNMYEAEILSDKVGIIVSGRIVMEGTPSSLKRTVYKVVPISFRLKITPMADLEGLRTSLGMLVEAGRTSITVNGDEVRLRIVIPRVEREESYIEAVTRISYEKGFKLLEARVEEPSLEDVFIEVSSRAAAN
ncbi:MAG: ABC transporter ATP-binding protein [Aeropyrum sp.]|nr:ABC transporter ATP-binding protein [Aeropyrum sp.]